MSDPQTTKPILDAVVRLSKLFRVVPHGKFGMAILTELEGAFSAGYAEGHEEQMKARILDAQERRNVG